MNRRSFFKMVTGFITGVLFAPKASSIEKIKKCPDCPDEDGSEFCEDPTCPYKP